MSNRILSLALPAVVLAGLVAPQAQATSIGGTDLIFSLALGNSAAPAAAVGSVTGSIRLTNTLGVSSSTLTVVDPNVLVGQTFPTYSFNTLATVVPTVSSPGAIQVFDTYDTGVSAGGGLHYFVTVEIGVSFANGLSFGTNQTVLGSSLGYEVVVFTQSSSSTSAWGGFNANGTPKSTGSTGQTQIQTGHTGVYQTSAGVVVLADGSTPGTVTVPEPVSMSILGFGLAGLAAARRRRSV